MLFLRHPIQFIRAVRSLRRDPSGLAVLLPLPSEADLEAMREG